MRIGVFGYDFPHKKTQDILTRLWLEGIDVDCVLASPFERLNIPASSIKTKVKHQALLAADVVANRIGARYYPVAHNSDPAVDLVRGRNLDVGIIAGARILKCPIIDAFNIGVINFHPGPIPESRGLDALLWSIYREHPLTVTVHLIDKHVDAGEVLLDRRIDIQSSDTLFDLSERLYETQLELLTPAIERARAYARDPGIARRIDPNSAYNRKMPPELEREVLNMFPEYVKKFAVPG